MDKLIFYVFLFFAFLLLSSSAQALVLTNHISSASFNPGETKYIGHITVVNQNNQTSVTTNSYSIFQTVLDPASFSLANGGIQNVSISVTIPPYHQAMNYSMPIVFVSADGLQQVDIQIQILEAVNYSLSSDTFSFNLTNNEQKIQSIEVRNLGNTDLSISAHTLSPFLAPMGNITLYKQQSFDFKTIVFSPENSSKGFYQENMTLYVSGQPNNISFQFWLSDDIKPNITDIRFNEEINFSEAQVVNFTVMDNAGISAVSATAEKPDGDVVDLEIVGNYTIEFADTNLIGEYIIVIDAEDTSGNRVSKPIIFEVIPVKILYIEPLADFGRVKAQEKYYPKNIGYLAETATLFFEISDEEVLNNTEIMINENPINGKTTEIKGLKGNLKMEIMSADVGEYDFYFEVTGEESLEIEDGRVDVFIQFLNYEPLGDFNDTWLGYNVSCSAQDTGILSTSTYDCMMSFPASDKYGKLFDFSLLTLPINPVWKEDWDNERQAEESRLNMIINQQVFFNWLFFIVMVLLGIGVFYFEIFKPRYS